MRSKTSPILLLSFAALSACSVKPILAPHAVGCYAVTLDSFPASFEKMLVPRPPETIRLDSAYSGTIQVPVAWLEGAGRGVRSASLGLLRPEVVIRGEQLVAERKGGPLPPDSLNLNFGGPGPALRVLLRADGSGDWRGVAYSFPAAPDGPPSAPVQLRRQDCGPTPMAISGTS